MKISVWLSLLAVMKNSRCCVVTLLILTNLWVSSGARGEIYEGIALCPGKMIRYGDEILSATRRGQGIM